VSQARASIACRSVEELGLSSAEIATHLEVSISGIPWAITKVER
jgi:orotate phosphoribosyltransferase-like protein